MAGQAISSWRNRARTVFAGLNRDMATYELKSSRLLLDIHSSRDSQPTTNSTSLLP